MCLVSAVALGFVGSVVGDGVTEGPVFPRPPEPVLASNCTLGTGTARPTLSNYECLFLGFPGQSLSLRRSKLRTTRPRAKKGNRKIK